ncbi:hypothetical protein ANN_25047 [Periplaneta americana]|uniref:Uncharacterized protein n=1 Tax=Periplaneta americana TaxID=6978 RepID=A0ABQ8S0W3_PERAM|nr:hypothetical protein ANN_25047 [Periplaneta americana]
MTGLCEGGDEPPSSLKASKDDPHAIMCYSHGYWFCQKQCWNTTFLGIDRRAPELKGTNAYKLVSEGRERGKITMLY